MLRISSGKLHGQIAPFILIHTHPKFYNNLLYVSYAARKRKHFPCKRGYHAVGRRQPRPPWADLDRERSRDRPPPAPVTERSRQIMASSGCVRTLLLLPRSDIYVCRSVPFHWEKYTASTVSSTDCTVTVPTVSRVY